MDLFQEPSQRVEMETQTPADIAVDAVPLSLSERPFPQGALQWRFWVVIRSAWLCVCF